VALAATGTGVATPVMATSTKIGFAALLSEYRAGVAEFEAYDDVSETRYMAAFGALLEARPTDPGEMAMQVRWLADELPSREMLGRSADGLSDVDLIRHVADQLERLAGA
jgi:hypothetical protein